MVNCSANTGQWKVNVSAYDSYSSVKSGRYLEVVARADPQWRNLYQDNKNISASASNTLRAEGLDKGFLEEAILATNETGQWQNKTGFYGSPLSIGLSDIWAQTPFEWDNDSIIGKTVGWRIWYRDALGQYTRTDTGSFYVKSEDNAPPTITIRKPENRTYSRSVLTSNFSADERIENWLYQLGNKEKKSVSVPGIFYTNSTGHVNLAYGNGSKKGFSHRASVLGDQAYLDSDEIREVPFINTGGDLVVLDKKGEKNVLDSGLETSQTVIGVGRWKGGKEYVFYPDATDSDHIKKARVGSSPSQVGSGIPSNGVIGAGDFNGDGDRDLVFLGTSDTVKYLDGGTVQSTGFSSFGSNRNKGVGQLADLDWNGVVRVPYVTPGNDIGLLDSTGGTTVLDSGYGKAAETRISAVDWKGNREMEVIHQDPSTGELRYMFLNGTAAEVTDNSQSSIPAQISVGVSRGNKKRTNLEIKGLEEGQNLLNLTAEDTSGNIGYSTRYFTVDTQKPSYRLLTDSAVGNLTQGSQTNITLELRDDVSGVNQVFLSTNETGNFDNKTLYGSPKSYANISGQWINEKFKWDNNSFRGLLGYRVWISDAVDNWKSTAVKTLTVEKPTITKFRSFSGQEWIPGNFSGTTPDRADNSGDLGLGYLNRTTANSWSPERNLVGLYRFDRAVSGSGGSVKDYSGLSNTGLTKGGLTTSASGVFSTGGVSFDGIDDWVNISGTAQEMAGGGFTWAGWIKTNGGDKRAIVAANTQAKSNNLMLYINNGKLSLYDGSYHNADTTVSDGQWRFVAVTLNDSTGRVDYFVDGEKEATTFTTSQRVSSTDLISIGQEWDSSPSDFFIGKMDEVQLYDKALTDGEIERLYFDGRTGAFRGTYNTTLDLKEKQRPFRLGINSSGVGSEEANISISTTNGEKDSIFVDSGDNYKNYSVEFSKKGGNATLNLNLSSKAETDTPVLDKINFYTITDNPPSYDLVVENVSLPEQNPVAGEKVEILAEVNNSGRNDIRDAEIKYSLETFNGSWNTVETSTKLVDLDSSQNKTISFQWTPVSGPNRIKITADPAGAVSEENETNNQVRRMRDISSYHIFFGGKDVVIELGEDGNNLTSWIGTDSGGNIYFSDTDNDYFVTDLMPLNGSSDLAEADDALNLNGNNDSIEKEFSQSRTRCFTVGGEQMCDIPYVNSTNTDSFQTGILYDTEIGTGFNGTQGLVFVSNVDQSKTGKYGTYDYEARVPATLGTQVPGVDKISIYSEVQ
jgi:hypothetical protein